MSTAALSWRNSNGSLALWLVPVLAGMLGLSIHFLGILALVAFFGACAFLVFVRYPVLGMYATVAMLILQGSTGIVGLVDQGRFAITIAQLAGLAALAAWLVNVLLAKVPFKMNRPVLFLAAFLLWTLFGTLLNGAWAEQFPQWFRLVTRFGLFFLAVNTLNTSAKVHTYLVVILVCGFVMAVSAVLQYMLPSLQVATASAWGGVGATDAAYVDPESLSGAAAVRVSGRAGHSNWLALFILLVLPLTTYWWQVSKTRRVRLFIALLVGIQLIALVLTFTRTGLVIGLALGLLLAFRRVVRITPVRVFSVMVLGVIGVAMLPSAYKERVLNPRQYTQSQSVMSRVELQDAALRYAGENPLFGLGPGGFGMEFIRENNETAATMKLMVYKMQWSAIFIGTHNMYLQLAADHGFVGLAIFALFFISMFRALLRKERQYRAEGDTVGLAMATALLVSLVGFMLCAVFLHALHQEIWWLIAAAAVAVPLWDIRFRPNPIDTMPEGVLSKQAER
jgi:O-antigen ligase